jgi:hypothetical protein
MAGIIGVEPGVRQWWIAGHEWIDDRGELPAQIDRVAELALSRLEV